MFFYVFCIHGNPRTLVLPISHIPEHLFSVCPAAARDACLYHLLPACLMDTAIQICITCTTEREDEEREEEGEEEHLFVFGIEKKNVCSPHQPARRVEKGVGRVSRGDTQLKYTYKIGKISQEKCGNMIAEQSRKNFLL